MIEKILIKIVTALVSRGLQWLLEKAHGLHDQSETNKNIDARLKGLKDAYAEAFDGNPITPEQRERLRASTREFILGNNSNGGL